jgi:hypothetical protein
MKRAWERKDSPETRINTGPGCARSDVIPLQPENVGVGRDAKRLRGASIELDRAEEVRGNTCN